jgi:hypothetical protein
VSLAPVAAGLLVTLIGRSIFDPLIAGAVAVWIIVSTVREVFASGDDLIWPEKSFAAMPTSRRRQPDQKNSSRRATAEGRYVYP